LKNCGSFGEARAEARSPGRPGWNRVRVTFGAEGQHMNILGPNPQRGYGPVDWNRLSQKRSEPSDVTPLNLLGARVEGEEEMPANGGSSDLLIRGLVERLPAIDETWPLAERAKWLRTAATIFALVYRTGEGEGGEIGVALTQPGTAPAKVPETAPSRTPEDASAKTNAAAPAKRSVDFSVLGVLSS
jgi:hypothetical protein